MRLTTTGKKPVMTLNSRVISPYLLRNSIGDVAVDMEKTIRETHHITVKWTDGTEHKINQLKNLSLGDTNSSPDIHVSKVTKALEHFITDAFDMTYGPSPGFEAVRCAIAREYRAIFSADVSAGDVIIGNGVTGLMDPIAKVFCSNDPAAPANFITSEIFYGPWVARTEAFPLTAKFVRIDSQGQPQVSASDIDSNTKFVEFSTVANPNGNAITENTVRKMAEALRTVRNERNQAVAMVVDDIYFDYLPAEKRINYFKIAENYGIPLIYIRGIDKKMGTGYHGASMTIRRMPQNILEELNEMIQHHFKYEGGSFLSIHPQTQILIGYNALVMAGASGKEIKEWMLGLPDSKVKMAGNRSEFERTVREYANWKNTNAPQQGLFSENVINQFVRDFENTLLMFKNWFSQLAEKIAKNPDILRLPFGMPDIPLYAFVEVITEKFNNSTAFALDRLQMTGIRPTPGLSFTSLEIRKELKYPRVRFAMVDDLLMSFDGKVQNAADVLIEYLKSLKS